MNNIQIRNRDLEAIAWGSLFVWWGVTQMAPALPAGSGLAGTGLILIGLNLARHLSGIAINGFTATLGVLALVWGGLELAGKVMHLPFELPVFAILLIVLGAIVLGSELIGKRNRIEEN